VKISNESKVGALTVVTVTVLILGYQFLRGKEVFKKEKIYYTVFADVNDLDVADEVKIKGYSVGTIKSMTRMNDHVGNTVVAFTVENSVNVYQDAIAELSASPIIGSRYIEIVNGKEDDFQESGDTLESNIHSGIQDQIDATIAPLKLKVEQMLSSIDTVVTSVQHFLNDTTLSAVQDGISGIAPALKSFSDAAKRIDKLITDQTIKISSVITNLDALSLALKESSPDIKNTFSNLSAISDSLKKAEITNLINNTKSSLAELDKTLSAINEAQGSMGKFIYDKEVYENLAQATKNLEVLLQDIQDHPNRYVTFSLMKFGGRDKKTDEKK